MREERERQEKLKLQDRDMAERAERAAPVNDGFVETNKMLQEKQRFDLQRRDAIADKEKME